MEELQNNINKLKTIINQNAALISQSELLVNIINQVNSYEVNRGKQLIVDAINSFDGTAIVEYSLGELAKIIKELNVIKNNLVLTSPLPITMGYILTNHTTEVLEIRDYNTKKVLAFPQGNVLRLIDCPNATSVATYYSSALTKANVLNCKTLSGTAFESSYLLIDLTIGKGFVGNVSLGKYVPSTAYSKTTSSLCFDTDLEEYGQIFGTNWDKWKWCIINHFAANLQDRTGMTAYTITFPANTLSQFDDEMKLAFTNKNWNLA